MARKADKFSTGDQDYNLITEVDQSLIYILLG